MIEGIFTAQPRTQIQKLDLFPIPVAVVEGFLTGAQCKDIFDFYVKDKKSSLNFSPMGLLDGGHGSVSSHTCADMTMPSGSEDIFGEIYLNVGSCSNIRTKFSTVMQEYEEYSGFECRKIINSWANIQQPGDELLIHTHPISNVSGALYINVDNDSSTLHLFNRNPYINFTKLANTTPTTSRTFRIKPQNGLLVMFPSWLSHSSNGEKNGTKDRMVISFNIF